MAAARERFAQDGYERATIRAIAADASIDPSMVMRYYGNKEKLFAAAAEFDLQLPDVHSVPRDQIGATLARHFLVRWERDETLPALLRAAATNEAAVERVREIFGRQLLPLVTAVSPEPGEVMFRAGLLATQMLGLALCRFVLRLPPVAALTPDEAAAWLGPTIQRYLTGSPARD
ncbi:TetR/AcrR family transcriptional regulator [Paractinoplanes rishiriensis]|uniref:TetR/AcrR family transcriptional regulator n=1 Tax=Paractinoplanes rishiriensis TaxID=1050105 RepID=UPI001EF2F9F7|nr:TetR family transcriptional regulator [Actinoplanes rishiriensis]